MNKFRKCNLRINKIIADNRPMVNGDYDENFVSISSGDNNLTIHILPKYFDLNRKEMWYIIQYDDHDNRIPVFNIYDYRVNMIVNYKGENYIIQTGHVRNDDKRECSDLLDYYSKMIGFDKRYGMIITGDYIESLAKDINDEIEDYIHIHIDIIGQFETCQKEYEEFSKLEEKIFDLEFEYLESLRKIRVDIKKLKYKYDIKDIDGDDDARY